MSKATRKKSGWSEFQSLQKSHSDTASLGVGRVYTTPPEADDAAHTRRLKAEAARNRAQHAGLKHRPFADQAPHYNPATDLSAPAARPGAEDALAIPSRINNRLHYRDGRVVDMGVAN